jgi:hypothetical protein
VPLAKPWVGLGQRILAQTQQEVEAVSQAGFLVGVVQLEVVAPGKLAALVEVVGSLALELVAAVVLPNYQDSPFFPELKKKEVNLSFFTPLRRKNKVLSPWRQVLIFYSFFTL